MRFVLHFAAYLIGLFYGIKFIYQLLKIIIQCKSLDVFKVKKRELPPKCLNDPELGNHVYVQLKVSIKFIFSFCKQSCI